MKKVKRRFGFRARTHFFIDSECAEIIFRNEDCIISSKDRAVFLFVKYRSRHHIRVENESNFCTYILKNNFRSPSALVCERYLGILSFLEHLASRNSKWRSRIVVGRRGVQIIRFNLECLKEKGERIVGNEFLSQNITVIVFSEGKRNIRADNHVEITSKAF